MNRLPRPLLIAGLLYLAASLGHFVHNAEFLDEYPNLPDWLTRGRIYLAWLVVALPGLMGWLAWARGRKALACGLFAAWGALGYLGLDHYYVAPVAAHTRVANVTILFEVLAGTALVIVAAVHSIGLLVRRRHGGA